MLLIKNKIILDHLNICVSLDKYNQTPNMSKKLSFQNCLEKRCRFLDNIN